MATDLRSPRPADVAAARELAAEYEMGPTAIATWLNQQGVQISRFAVARWLDPAKAERHRVQTRDWHRRRRAPLIKPRRVSPEARLERMQTYRDAGLSYQAIAIVMATEYGTPITWRAVERATETGRIPRCWRKETTTR